MSDEMDERIWEAGWDGHLDAQLRRMARLPLWEKIAWLEDAQRLAARLTAQRAGTSGKSQPPEQR